MSLTNALTRIKAITSSALGTSWKEADEKVVDLLMERPPGVDKKYLVRVVGRETPGLTSSNIRNTISSVDIQLSRELSGGKNYNYDAVQADLEDKAFSIIKDVETYTNWNYSTTEIVLINTLNSESIKMNEDSSSLVWTIQLEVHIRRSV